MQNPMMVAGEHSASRIWIKMHFFSIEAEIITLVGSVRIILFNCR
jgi:hypothetical protein